MLPCPQRTRNPKETAMHTQIKRQRWLMMDVAVKRQRDGQALCRCCGAAVVLPCHAARLSKGTRGSGGVVVPRRLDHGGHRRVVVPVVRVGAG